MLSNVETGCVRTAGATGAAPFARSGAFFLQLEFQMDERRSCKVFRRHNYDQLLKDLMKNWYESMTKGQRIFVYCVSVLTVLIYGIGLIALAVLIYLELGRRGEKNSL